MHDAPLSARMVMGPTLARDLCHDDGRRPGFDDAVAKYQRLTAIYPALGCDVVLLPKFPPQNGHDFVLVALAERCGQDMTVGR